MVGKSGTVIGRCKLEKWLRNNTMPTKDHGICPWILVFISMRRLMIGMLQCSFLRNDSGTSTKDGMHHRYAPVSP